MRLECPAKALAAAVKLCLPAIVNRGTVRPVLQCVRIDAAPGNVTVSATDLEVGIRASVLGCEVTDPGAVCLTADKLAGILAEAGAAPVRLDAGADVCTIRAGRARHTLSVQPAAEFPEVRSFDPDRPHFAVSGPALAGLIRRTAFAASRTEGTKWGVTGVLLELETDPDTIRMVATDTKRLPVASAPARSHDAGPATVVALVPMKALRRVEEVSNADTGDVLIDVRTTEVTFRTATATIHTTLLEGRFPPYREIMPKKAAKVTVDLKLPDLLAGVRQAAVTTDQESKRVDFAFAPGAVTLTTQTEAGESEVVVDLPGFEGPALDISMDPGFLTEFCRNAEAGAEPARLELWDKNKPALFHVGDCYRYLVMPLTK